MMNRVDKTLPIFPAGDAARERFRHGQVVFGKIERIQGEGEKEKLALVRVGNEIVTARLRTPLQAGKQYLFEVVAENDTIYWKIIDKEGGNHPFPSSDVDEAAQYLIRKWKLPNDAHSFLRFVLQEKLPIAKEDIEKAVQWIGQLEDKQKGWETFRYMFVRRFPLTKDIFTSLLAVQNDAPLFRQLQTAERQLASLPPEQQTNSLQTLRRYLQNIMNSPKNAYEVLVKLLASLQQPERKAALQLLSKLGLSSLQNNLSSEQLMKLQDAVHNGDLQQARQYLQSLFPAFEEQPFLERFQMLYASYADGSLAEEEQRLFSAILTQSDRHVASSVFHALKEALEKLGFQHEANIRLALETKTPAETTMTSLKPLLLQALENIHEPELKETLQTLLHHITGQQLLSKAEGPLQHLFLQIPVQLGEHRTDVAIYWQGKRQKNGKIDPDYCRIMFYFYLDNLKETVVDVRVQQRIVHVSVINDTPHLPAVATAFQPMLKERLEEHGYTLSVLKVETPKQKKAPVDFVFAQRYSGVDYRI
ncbi:hypothetical protein [Parageobacillus thermoglucosidasius]|uniref:hypothetical protein n=1 Tax=Parageobacillus thermoglucosidasius TaxID=1426 RepID=UPI001F2F2D63|nr:hypothetical protein [Parageobacillus thermoglucosidasius]